MTNLNTRESGAATGTGDRSRPRAALPALCLTQITGWGIVYYAFPVLNPQITANTGWPAGATTAAFSAALLVSALAGIRVGRILDTRGPRTVMTAGSVLGALSILIVAAAIHAHQQAAMPEEYLGGRTTDAGTWLRTPKNLERLAAITRATDARRRAYEDTKPPAAPDAPAADGHRQEHEQQHRQPGHGQGPGPRP